MKALLFSLLLFGSPFETNQTTTVFICTGPKATRYHSKSNCRGLNRCSGDIERVSLEKAKQLGRTACGICY